MVREIGRHAYGLGYDFAGWVSDNQLVTTLSKLAPGNQIEVLSIDRPAQNKVVFTTTAFMSSGKWDAATRRVLVTTFTNRQNTEWSVALDGSPPQKIRKWAN